MKYLIKRINEFSTDDIKEFVNKIPLVKLERISKMNEISFKQSVVGEILLSKLLEEEHIDYTKIKVRYNENGKPYISNYQMYYNIAHDNDYVICAINTSGPIGVDILRMDDISKNVAKAFCSKEELAYIKNKYQFYQVFTLKEAYLKLFGKKINDIKFLNIIQDNKIKLNVINKSLVVDNNYIVSICYELN